MPKGRIIFTKQILNVIIFFCIDPKDVDFVSSMGVTYYIRRSVLLLSLLKKRNDIVCINGIAFFDIIYRVTFIAFAFAGMSLTLESFLESLLLAIFIYAILAWIENEQDHKRLKIMQKFFMLDE